MHPFRSFTVNEGGEVGRFPKGDVGGKRGFFKIRIFVVVAEDNESSD